MVSSGCLRLTDIKTRTFMSRKRIAAATVLALVLAVFAWSLAMAAMGHASLIAGLAPILGLTVNQVLRGTRPRSTSASGHHVVPVPDEEDGAP
ncbi:hypothetical protein ACIBAI_22315 [Streptomyces sp. NPDC051041]|uniref:hypothetical protein n=1 Tax=Streptomyces sp. NPDC051041 TaxID=3365640 RepID=UPI00378C6650